MELIVKVAQSFQYRGTPVIIQIDPYGKQSKIITDKHTETVACSNDKLLEKIAEKIVDREIDGNLFKYRNSICDDVSY
jgi:hypothetical protein